MQASLSRTLASAAGSETVDWAQPLIKELSAAGFLDKADRQQHAAWDAAELSAFVDIQILMSATLLVMQAAAGFDPQAVQAQVRLCWEGLAARAANDRTAVAVRLHMAASEVATVDDNDMKLASAPEALALMANIAWLLHCRQQVGRCPRRQS